MKIKLDENLPFSLATVLDELGHDVHTTREEGLSGHADREIWRSAQNESRFLITQDMDFSDSRRFAPGSHCGILLVRLRSPSRKALIERVTVLFQTENVNRWERCFVVASERKLRIVKPPGGTG
jgi:predicted nuclease of predicted toxin-antitoxin system